MASKGNIRSMRFSDAMIEIIEQQAKEYWNRSRDMYRDKHGYMPEPIYVETGRRKRN